MSDRVQQVTVEIQIRTIAMDFWASLEHKIYYKYNGAVPETLQADLKQAADVASRLDVKMESLHDQVIALESGSETADSAAGSGWISELPLSREVLQAFARGRTAPGTLE
jgi:putative GTP pyrophosphokinase